MSIKYKVLVAEDELKIREILVDCLMDDYEVIEAKDGLEALRLFHSQQFDLVLLDVMMPEKDGFSVLKEIRLVSKVPVIMLTARSSVEDQVRGYDLKVDDYVTKPFDNQVLLAKVHRLLSRINEDDEVETYEYISNSPPIFYEFFLYAYPQHEYHQNSRFPKPHLKKIRKKLGDYSKYIHTVFGVGYKFEVI